MPNPKRLQLNVQRIKDEVFYFSALDGNKRRHECSVWDTGGAIEGNFFIIDQDAELACVYNTSTESVRLTFSTK